MQVTKSLAFFPDNSEMEDPTRHDGPSQVISLKIHELKDSVKELQKRQGTM